MSDLAKRTWILLTVCFFVAVTSIAFTTLYADTNDRTTLPERTRPSVDFLNRYHDSHMENLQCLDCHHKYVDGKNVLDEDELEEGNPNILCSSCHNEKSKIKFTRAFHEECIGCHDRLSKEGEKTGPSLCGECHARQKVETGSIMNGDKNG